MSSPSAPDAPPANTPKPRLPRYRTGHPELDRDLNSLLDAAEIQENRDQIFEIMAAALRLGADGADRLDVKITNAAIREMRQAFRVFAPYRGIPKVTVFGSARTQAGQPGFELARELAREMAAAGWMVVSGAGPGIMAATIEGAGKEHSLGVTIRLPFEPEESGLLFGDPKHASMKYFFTRKLMLIKESKAVVALPGGFGTLDETFELLTLLQTGKADMVPIVLMDPPQTPFWSELQKFIDNQLIGQGLVSPGDRQLYRIVTSAREAVAEIRQFWSSYNSLRWVGDDLVLRLNRPVGDSELAALQQRHAGLTTDGLGPRRTEPLADERIDNDKVDLPRLILKFDRRNYAGLRELIDEINAHH